MIKKKNKVAFQDMQFISKTIMLSKESYNFNFTVDQEEMFAKSWEKYMRDGIPPNKQYAKLFKDFRFYIIKTSHDKNDKDGRENYEFFDVTISPAIKDFFDKLIIGQKLKVSPIRKIVDTIIIIYFVLFFILVIYKLYTKL